MRWNNSSPFEQAGSRSGSIGHLAQHSGTRRSSLSHPVREGGRADEPFGLPGQLSITLLGVAGCGSLSPAPYPPTPRTVPKRKWCTSWCGAAPCPPGHPSLSPLDLISPSSRPGEGCWWGRRSSGSAGMPTLFNCGLTADRREESILSRKINGQRTPSSHNLHGSQPRNRRPEKWAALTAAESVSEPKPHQTDRKTET